MATRKAKNISKPPLKLNYATPALEKGLDVIELLAHQPSGLTKSQMARELNRTVSEIFRMLVCLEQRGYIATVDNDQYTLTLKLFQLVQEHPPTERLIADALPVMQRFSHDSLQSCHLGVLEDARIVIIAQVNAPTSVGFYVKLGSTVNLMEAATGYVILAHQDKEHLERTLAEWTRQTGKKAPRDFEKHLERIRKAGFEKRASYQVKGVVNISFPILDSRGSALCALTVPYIQSSVDNKVSLASVTQSLRKAAGEITAAVGGRPVAE
jgi:DNA-binding IclR family transcriptional regulator